jgi:hypothetical protein
MVCRRLLACKERRDEHVFRRRSFVTGKATWRFQRTTRLSNFTEGRARAKLTADGSDRC